MSPAERARRALSDAGFSVFRPGEAMGPCKEAYLVVFDGGLTPAGRSGVQRAVGVAAYAPLGRQQELFPMLNAASAALNAEGLKPRGGLQPEAIDEAFRAHTQSAEFTALCAV